MPVTIERLSPDHFPEQFLNIPQKPKQLYIRGNNPFTGKNKFVTVVGSRNYTNYGADAARHIIAGLAGFPVTIVSGLAIGIDTIAHRTALEYKIPTIAFPGSGLAPSVLYPSSNRSLAETMVESGGALISEFEPETKAAQYTFPVRNRLMAALADLVIIIEAEHDSGTRITANLALEYGRNVGVVPGSIFSKTSSGCHDLLRLGAMPITGAYDVLLELGLEEQTAFREDDPRLTDATELELQILSELRNPLSRNELSRLVNQSISDIGVTVSIMELKGFVVEELGEVRRVI